MWSEGINLCSQVGLLMDLTNTWRYYERDEIDELGIWHLKVPPLFSWGFRPLPEGKGLFM